MLLENLALLFSNQISQWPVATPSKALPFYIRSFIKNSWGRGLSANDSNRKDSPNRLGVFIRNFQAGDPLKTLSLSHLLRMNSFVTKMDVSPGRKKVLVLLHCYNNMTYRSEFSQVNKGQVAHGICAILEEIHQSLSQNFTIKASNEKNFFDVCKQYHKSIQSYEKIYFISDFLSNSENLEACATEVQNIIKCFNLKRSLFFIVRDPLECAKNNVSQETYKLSSWMDGEQKQQSLYGDIQYKENLEKQIAEIEERIKQTQNFSKLVMASDSVAEFLSFINNPLLDV